MYRTGQGFDSHRFITGRPLKLGGVEIPHDQGLAAHSDGDALLHALTDAILGAIGSGDIGELFPDSDPANRDADSSRFLQAALQQAKSKGYRVGNCDATIITQQPRIGPFKQQIVERLASLMDIAPDRIAVKAKTAERMGAIGAGEGLACLASVLVVSDSTQRAEGL
jgi:2-C-methyl-D-erythritol 2,4-cyclodiphosphate synthase